MCVLQRIFHFWGSTWWRGGTKALRKVPAPQVLFKRTWEFEYLDLMTRRLFLFCAFSFLSCCEVFNFDSLFSLWLCRVEYVIGENSAISFTRACRNVIFLFIIRRSRLEFREVNRNFALLFLFSCNASRIYNVKWCHHVLTMILCTHYRYSNFETLNKIMK